MSNFLDKLWKGTTVFEEPVCFSEFDASELIGGSLLYAPSEILKVTSLDGAHLYEINKDYNLEGHRIV